MILPLTFQDVSFEIGGTRLIKDLNCTLEAGPRTMILGANGAGKSLFLRLCHGLIRPTTGRVLWQGAKGRDPTDAQAMVFQRPVMLRRSVAATSMATSILSSPSLPCFKMKRACLPTASGQSCRIERCASADIEIAATDR